MLAACRRRDAGRLLTDESLLLLADESWTVLDLNGAQHVRNSGPCALQRSATCRATLSDGV